MLLKSTISPLSSPMLHVPPGIYFVFPQELYDTVGAERSICFRKGHRRWKAERRVGKEEKIKITGNEGGIF